MSSDRRMKPVPRICMMRAETFFLMRKEIPYARKPMLTKPDVDNYFKKLSDSLMREDSEIWCAAILKFWVPDEIPEGTFFINVPELFEFMVDYIRENLRERYVLS